MNKVSINAWTGDDSTPPESNFGPEAKAWMLGAPERRTIQHLAPATLPDLDDWTDKRVGWGVIVATKGDFSDQERSAGKDLENDAVLQQLLADRKTKQGVAPVFHWGAGAAAGHGGLYLRNYASGKDLDLTSGVGLENDELPHYLLIYASPGDIPWEIQYTLQVQRSVGRLDPAMPGLENYVKKLIDGWSGAGADAMHTLTWAVDHGGGDITSLMRKVVAARIHAAYAGDPDPSFAANALLLDGSNTAANASGASLIANLIQKKPGVVVTSSHGKTGPLDNIPAMLAELGVPVDQQHHTLDLASLLDEWQPDGAVWYAQACCSAGSNAPSAYAKLFDPTSQVGAVLHGVAKGGSHIAPLPSLLLGCSKPARAFFGQVEPTFNFTLRNPGNNQVLTDPLCNAFYNRLFQPKMRLGRVLKSYWEAASTKFRQWQFLTHKLEQGENVDDELLYTRMTGVDIDSLVMIGDPTATLA